MVNGRAVSYDYFRQIHQEVLTNPEGPIRETQNGSESKSVFVWKEHEHKMSHKQSQ